MRITESLNKEKIIEKLTRKYIRIVRHTDLKHILTRSECILHCHTYISLAELIYFQS